jgi:hypothetical protein
VIAWCERNGGSPRAAGHGNVGATGCAQDYGFVVTAARWKNVGRHGRNRCGCVHGKAGVAERGDTGRIAADDVPTVKHQLTFDVQNHRVRVHDDAGEGDAPAACG